jgi:pyruvate,water dikinase
MPRPAQPDILWFKEIDKNDGPQVGGKGANLGEMVGAGFPVPDGFVVTAQAYYKFLEENNLRETITETLSKLDPNDSQQLDKLAKKVQKLIVTSKMPKDLAESIKTAYNKLGKNVFTAVRSSATAEDLPGASFAGQQATYLNISGADAVVKHVQKAWASLFEARAVFYRVTRGFDHNKVGIAVPVQRMVQSDVSGVMFSMNPVNNDDQTVVVEAIWGLGENIVQGIVTPDHYEIEKGTWDILRVDTIEQKMEMSRKFGTTKNRSTPITRRKKTKLSQKHMIALAKLAVKLQQHYHYPQDCEWALENDVLYLVQTRPITTIENIDAHKGSQDQVEKHLAKLPVILSGEPASPGIVSGKVRLIKTPHEIHNLKSGEIMLTSMTTPDFVPAMKRAIGLITDRGGQTSHAAIVSRELGLPCVVGTSTATKDLKDGQIVTINGRTGEIHQGQLSRELLSNAQAEQEHVREARQAQHIKTATKIYVNLAEPELAKEVAARDADGVGLLRAEFMIAQLGHHPKDLLAQGKGKVFSKQLAKGLSEFCEAFGERPVVYRATDFKTNEYRHLVGGEKYEPQEENPLIGYRGAYRYMSDPKVFALELEAIKEVRKKHSNLWVMIPFVRSVQEFQRVKKIMYEAGLRRSSSFKIWMMAELPENVIMIDDYIDAGVDGFSIGTNDLTMLILGTDRDNENVASEYDERHPAVQWALERLVRKCRARGVSISVCGQGPSTYHELAEKRVEWGVTSLSVTPDVLELTREVVAEAEARMIKPKRK